MFVVGLIAGYAIGLFIVCGILAHRDRKENEALYRSLKNKPGSFRASITVDLDDLGDQ